MFIDVWKNECYCPTCDKWWTAVSLVADYEKISLYSAYIKVNEWIPQDDSWKDKYREIEKMTQLFKRNYAGSKAQEYMQSRWIDDTTAEHFNIWYAPSWFFKDRVIFPIKNLYGYHVWFTARTLIDEMPKYKNSSNSPIFQKKRLLYGYDSQYRYDSYILVEWQMDVIKLQMMWYGNAVCSSWTAINRDQLVMMKKVYICLDQDEAWEKATKRVIFLAKQLWVEYEVIKFEWAKDPDEFISNGWDIYKILPIEWYAEVIDTKSYTNILAWYAVLNEDEVEQSALANNWLKSLSDSMLLYYQSTLPCDYTRYKIDREIRFRRSWNDTLIDVDVLKKSIPIDYVISSYGINIPSWRSNIPCPLPDHKDGTPSFSINKQHNLFKCFWCNKWWSQIDFIMEMEKCDATTAIQKLTSFM